MRLIDADELMIKFEAAQKEADRHGRAFASCFYDDGGEVSTNWYCVEDMVDNAPTVDAVTVVRCKDCRYWQDNNGGKQHNYCKWRLDETPDEDDFCSLGDWKDGEHNED